MSDKVMTKHPEGKEGVNIDRAKYDAVKGAIIDAIRSRGEMPFGELADAVGQRLTDFDGSIGWYTTTVKLDLEARGEIARMPGSGPQKLRLTTG